MNLNQSIILLAGIALLSGCGPSRPFKQARGLENKGFYVEAGMKYEGIVRKYPADPLAPESLFRLGKIYQNKLKLYAQACNFFNQLIEKYPKAQPWADRARLAILDSPDFFPLTDGSFWIEGDSDTRGRNMRSEWNCRRAGDTIAILRRTSAGTHLVSEVKRFYRKVPFEVRESADAVGTKYGVILRYPFIERQIWTASRDGRTIRYAVVGRDISLQVSAGSFTGCIKISEQDEALPGSFKYSYYAPGVGWVLTTTAAAGGDEHRNTELISYKVIPEE